eukprot:COSAG02_NODE_2142_length_9685_cov_83.241707_9_plen_96_part_00
MATSTGHLRARLQKKDLLSSIVQKRTLMLKTCISGHLASTCQLEAGTKRPETSQDLTPGSPSLPYACLYLRINFSRTVLRKGRYSPHQTDLDKCY